MLPPSAASHTAKARARRAQLAPHLGVWASRSRAPPVVPPSRCGSSAGGPRARGRGDMVRGGARGAGGSARRARRVRGRPKKEQPGESGGPRGPGEAVAWTGWLAVAGRGRDRAVPFIAPGIAIGGGVLSCSPSAAAAGGDVRAGGPHERRGRRPRRRRRRSPWEWVALAGKTCDPRRGLSSLFPPLCMFGRATPAGPRPRGCSVRRRWWHVRFVVR